MPFGRNGWMCCCQAVGGRGCPVGTGRTTRSIDAMGNCCVPLMSACTLPPNSFPTLGRQVVWSQIIIIGWMPLAGYFRVDSCQAIGLIQPSVDAKRTAAAISPVLYYRLPFMVSRFGAFPPHPLAAAGGHGGWCQISIFCRMPFPGNLWVRLGQASRSRRRKTAATGTSGAPHPAHDTGFPLMVLALGALPPNLPVGACPYILGTQLPVLGRMPLPG